MSFFKDLFKKMNPEQEPETDDLNMDYTDFYSGRSARPADAPARPAEGTDAPRAGGYYDTPARPKGGYEEPDFQSDNSRYYDAPAADTPAESFVRPREVYVEPETDPRAPEGVFAPAPAPEYLYFAPNTYADCRESIVKNLADGNIVVVRLGGLQPKDILRIFDYMMGAVTVLDAEFIRPEPTTVVLVPNGVELDEEDLEFEDEEIGKDPDADEGDEEDYEDEYDEDGYEEDEEYDEYDEDAEYEDEYEDDEEYEEDEDDEEEYGEDPDADAE